MTKTKQEEKALYFASDYAGPLKPVNLEKASQSVKLHVKKIEEANVESVLDLGCGAGGILLALQNSGVEEIHGIDASPEAIELLKKRFEKFGTLENTSFTVGDIIQFDPPTVDVVSSHSVICCHPNAIGMINKATEKNPKLVIITFPKDNFLTKSVIFSLNILLWIGGLFNRSIRGRKSFVHSTKNVNATFEKNGYELVFTDTSSFSQTLIYEKSN